MRLPDPRGSLSGFVIDALSGPPGDLGAAPPIGAVDALEDDDFQLALYVAYELHYRGFDDVDDRWEWEPSLIAFRTSLEGEFEKALRAAVSQQGISAERVP